MTSMPMPDWYHEAKGQLNEVSLEKESLVKMKSVNLKKIEGFPQFFAEYELKGDDVIMHLFPRLGLDDKWTEGRYIDKCGKCGATVPLPAKTETLRACDSCGSAGLKYLPSRTEEPGPIKWSEYVATLIKEAVSLSWLGDAALELVPELGAYALQIRDAGRIPDTDAFVMKICKRLGEVLPHG